jgi:hypothetical protein
LQVALTQACATQTSFRPYANERDNRLDTFALLALLYSYFASVIVGTSPSSTIDASVVAVKVAVLVYAVWRVARNRLRQKAAIERIDAEELQSPLL